MAGRLEALRGQIPIELLNNLLADVAEADPPVSAGGTDEKIKITASDTTAAVLNSKLTPASGLQKATLNPGANEQLELSPNYGSSANTVCEGNDARLSDSRAPSGSASGDLGGTYPGPSVAALTTTTGPTSLTIGAVADGEYLQRSGSTVVGASVAAGDNNKVKVTASDTTTDFLNAKVTPANGLQKATLNPGVNEQLQLSPSYGSSVNTVAQGNDGRFPTTDEKAALAGTGTPAAGNPYVSDDDSRMTDSRAPSGSASGDLGGTYPSPSVAALTTTTGPTSLTVGAVADGEFLQRSGATLIGATPAGGGAGTASITTGTLNLYVNGSTGSDSNDGLSVGQAKKTWQGVFDLIEDLVGHGVHIHAAGTFTNDVGVLARYISKTAAIGILIDGGSDVVEVQAARPCTSPSASIIADAILSPTLDQDSGYIIEMVDGTAAGQRRTIVKTEKLTNALYHVGRNFNPVPTTGDNYRIVRPATTMAGTSRLAITLRGGALAKSFIQRLHFQDTTGVQVFGSDRVGITHCTSESSLSPTFDFRWNQRCKFHDQTYTDTDGNTDANSAGCGLGIRSTGRFYVYYCQDFFIEGGYFGGVTSGSQIYGSVISIVKNGAHFTSRPQIENSDTVLGFRGNDAGHQGLAFRNADHGLTIEGGNIEMVGPIEFADNSFSGMFIQRGAHVKFSSNGNQITGGDNGTYGVHLRTGSQVHFVSGQTPSVTGLTANCFIDDGVLGTQTWININGGTEYSSTKVMCCVSARA